jgi:hypothetical protein
MPEDSIMDMVNNIEPLHDDKIGLYRKWIREGEDWDERKALKEARALAAHFAEAIEARPGWPSLRQPHYSPADFDQAAEEMIEEFKTEERPKWE